jgi:hypothetical protein
MALLSSMEVVESIGTEVGASLVAGVKRGLDVGNGAVAGAGGAVVGNAGPVFVFVMLLEESNVIPVLDGTSVIAFTSVFAVFGQDKANVR